MNLSMPINSIVITGFGVWRDETVQEALKILTQNDFILLHYNRTAIGLGIIGVDSENKILFVPRCILFPF